MLAEHAHKLLGHCISSLSSSLRKRASWWNEGDKALITHQVRKFAAEVHLHMFGVIGFEGIVNSRKIVELIEEKRREKW
jgi:hypothetical protein